jgi:hypothetical protein
MANYSSKFRVFQNWGTPTAGTPLDQNVFVFGPQYDLHRYSDVDEREQLTRHYFEAKKAGADDSRTNLVIKEPFEVSAVNVLDEASVEVYAENAYINLLPGVSFYELGELADVTVVGDYLDGVLRFNGKKLIGKSVDPDLASPVALTDVIAFRPTTGDGSWEFVNILKIEIDGADTVVTLVDGLPDFVSDGNAEVYICRKFASVKVEPSKVTSEVVEIGTNTTVKIGDNNRLVLVADVAVGYRTLHKSASVGIHVATSMADVEDVLGKADPANPIAMGVFNAFVGGAFVVYYYVTGGESVAEFTRALELSRHNKTLYYLVPMSQDAGVLTAVVAHVTNMSNENVKHWRTAFLCSAVEDSTTTDFEVTGLGVYSQNGVKYVVVKADGGAPDAVEGDVIELADGRKFVAARKMNRTSILTKTKYVDPESGVDDEYAFVDGETVDATITHTLTSHETAAAAAGAAKSYGTHRAVDVFPKTYKFGGETYSSLFAAPIIAGMKASVVPQAPITNAVIPGVDDVPDTYAVFTDADLDTAAAGGCLVMKQDQAGDAVYVRKQITTGVSSNVLAKSELSMVVNFDNITYQFDSLIEGYKGSYNVTPSLIRRIRADILARLYYLAHNTASNDLVGSQILDGRIESINVDPTNATRIIAHVVVVLPAPFNEMDLYLTVDVSTEVTETTEATVGLV